MQLLGDAVETGRLAAPEDGPVDWTAHADMAAGIAAILADPDFAEPMVELTGPEAVDLAGIAERASAIAERPIERIVVPDDDFRAGLLERGVPEDRAGMLMGIFLAARAGGFTRGSPTPADRLGRPATAVRDVLRDALT